ncbi:NADP-dependent oxidoreductase [Rhizobium leguminosarum]|uniref:NADP-dependent oxidoreductase n=1 Tax=Rhizobium leguminosarum TaxID=384 RepID=UPI0024B328E7|nr:NADP-dependent oxidoreductase [Rhizobium leguminosarum]WHO82765.1 NADP-dependent oxidoreductase [Rhizobium leguminosarum]
MSKITSTQIQIISYPTGWPTPQDFRTVQVVYDDLQLGQVRVVNEYVSVDPYMRFRMNAGNPGAFPLGQTMMGTAVGRVVESAADHLPVGSTVLHEYGWRDVAQEAAEGFQPIPEYPGVPHSLHLGMFGLVGLTAYAGLTRVARLRKGDTVYVSGAAGAVGSTAGQLARLLGAGRVVGSAGSKEKVELLTSRYGYDAAFNYRDGSLTEQLARAAPEGVDVFFDNVGGDHLSAALPVLNIGGRVALCGAISVYNEGGSFPSPQSVQGLSTPSIELLPFTVADYLGLLHEFRAIMVTALRDGRIVYDETVVDGIEHAVQAFLDMMRGRNIGKMIVKTDLGQHRV